MFNISIRIREYPGNIIVKDIKGISLFRPKLLKPEFNNKILLKIKKTYFNIIVIFSTHTTIIKTEGI